MAAHEAIEDRVCRRPLEIRLLGPVRVLTGAEETLRLGGAKPTMVLVRLALHAGEVVTTDHLVDTLWGDDPPPTARRSLQAHVAKLRAVLGGDEGPISSRGTGYVLDLPRAQVDVLRIEDRLGEARELLPSDPFRASELVSACRREWVDPPLADLEGCETLAAERERLVRLGDELDDTEVEVHVALGDPVSSILRLERAVVDQPTHEPHWVRLVTAYYASGRQQDALEAYGRARSVLREQLGVDPSPRLRQLELQILRHDVDDRGRREACPYKGLAAYQIADGYMFYGRSDTVDEVVALVQRAPFGAVVGPSGVGKSSVLRAGLGHRVVTGQVPGIRSVTVITPGARPLRSLYEAPPAVDLLVVDQFEELFTLTEDARWRFEFVDELVTLVAAGRTRVVICVRADFYAQCLAIPALVPVLARHQVVVGAMSDGSVREAIRGPARGADLDVESTLVDAVVDEVSQHPGALPMLSHALRETWRRRTGSTLTLAAYREAGSIAGAIAATAERLYDGLDSEPRNQTRLLFRRLVEPGAGPQHARRAAPRQELVELGIGVDLIDRLVSARLLTATAEDVEIAHEALISAWPRLAGWIDEARDDIVVQQRLTRAAAAWIDDGRDDADLYRGHKLDAALAWRRDASAVVSAQEDEFLRASETRAEAESTRQRRANRRLRTLAAVCAVAMLVAAAAGVVAVDRSRDAERRRAEAEADRVAALVANDESLTHTERLLAAVALEASTPTAETTRLLVETLLTIPDATRSDLDIIAVVGDAPVYSTGMALLVLDDHARPAVVDAATLELERLPVGLDVEAVLARPDEPLVVLTHSYEVIDPSSGDALGPELELRAEPAAAALSGDGGVLALAYDASVLDDAGGASIDDASVEHPNAVIDLVDVASGATTMQLATNSSTIGELEFAVDGSRLMAVADDRAVVVWDVEAGRQLVRIDDDSVSAAPVTAAAFGRAGDSVALGRQDGSVEIWQEYGDRWRSVRESVEHGDAVTWLDFDALDALMVSSSLDGSAIVWKTDDGTRWAGPVRFDSSGSLTSFFEGTPTDVVTIDMAGRVWRWRSAPGGALVEIVPAAAAAGPRDGGPRWVGAGGDQAVVVNDEGLAPLDVAGSVIDVVNGWSGDYAIVFEDRLEWYRGDGELVLTIPGQWDRFPPRVALGPHSIAYSNPDARRRILVRDDLGAVVEDILVPSGLRGPPARIDLDPTGTDLVYSTEAGELIWYALDGFEAAVVLGPGRGHDGHFVGEDRALAIGTEGVQLVDLDGPTPEIVDLPIGQGALQVAVDEERRLAATTGATGALTLWSLDSRRPLGSPIDVLGDEPPRWISFGNGDRLLVGGGSRTAVIDLGIEVACGVLDSLGEDLPQLAARYIVEAAIDAEVC